MQPPDYLKWRFWMDIGVLAGVSANFVYTWWANREKITGGRFKTLEDEVARRVTRAELDERDRRCSRHKERTQALESELRHLPARQELTKLSDDIANLNGTIANLGGRLEGINRAVDLLNQHHLAGGK